VDACSIPLPAESVEEPTVSSTSPAARCPDCSFTWNSAGMVEGLRLLGTCPRCGTGRIEFRDASAGPSATHAVEHGHPGRHDDVVPPHLVLGLPRR